MTIFGASAWWVLAAVALLICASMAICWFLEESLGPRRRLGEQWPAELADQGRADHAHRRELLAGEPVVEDPAVVKSVGRARRRGRLS